MRFSCAKLLAGAGLLSCACAGHFNHKAFHEAFAKKFSNQKEIWRKEIQAIRSAGYLAHFSVASPQRKTSGTLEIYYLSPDTAILFSPGFLGKGSLRGRWILGEKLSIYFPRENKYYEGSWEEFLFGREKETPGLDSVVFGILSRKGFLPGPISDSASPGFTTKKGGGWRKTSSWGWREDFGKWERYHIFNRRDKLAMVRWYSQPREVEIEVDIDKNMYSQLSPKRVKWVYVAENVSALINVERAIINVEIPAAKKNFQIPPDAILLERIEINEER